MLRKKLIGEKGCRKSSKRVNKKKSYSKLQVSWNLGVSFLDTRTCSTKQEVITSLHFHLLHYLKNKIPT